MNATFEVHEGCTTLLSDEGYRRLADEQRMQRLEPLYAGGTIIGAAGVVLAIAGFVVAQILGAS